MFPLLIACFVFGVVGMLAVKAGISYLNRVKSSTSSRLMVLKGGRKTRVKLRERYAEREREKERNMTKG